MSKINVLRELFNDIKYRASQKGFNIETQFDSKRSAIQVIRIVDGVVVYRLIDELKKDIHPKFLKQEMLSSQIKTYEHFISYMSFYGIFTVAFSYDEEQLEKRKTEEEKEKKLKKKENKNA